MSDYKSGWPPPPPGQPLSAPTSPVPMAPPRSVPPAATPQRIPVPGSSPPGASSPPPLAAPPAWPLPQSEPGGPPRVLQGHEPVDLDAEVMEEAPEDEMEAAPTPAMPQLADAQAVLAPMRPMRRLAIGDPDSRPSAPPPEEERAVPPAGVPPAITAPAGTPPGLQGSSGAAAPPAAQRERLPSFDDPEHGDGSDRVGLTPAPPMLTSSEVETVPPSSDPDEVDTPVPVAPVHVSAPPPFIPPPSPLLPDFASVPPAPPVMSTTRREPTPEESRAAAGAAEPAEPPRRPSRPPPVVPEAVVRSIQPAAYQAEQAAFETHAPLDDDEMRLSDTDLEISTTGEPPEVVPEVGAEVAAPPIVSSAPGLARPPLVAAAGAVVPIIEAPAPDLAQAPPPPDVASADAPSPDSSSTDAKKPPPPKRTAKPALPSAAVRRRPWWETLFGDDFARAHRSPTPRQLAREVNYMVTTLALAQNQVVLDLGCGQGEHTVELTRRGVAVVGYDLSVFQLAMAGDRAQQEGQKINFLQGDMREMAFDSMFDAVVCWDTTFGYFEEEKNVDVARRILNGLKPGGSLLLHVMNRDFAAKESPTNIWFEGDGCVCMDDVDFDWITSRLRVKRSLILDDGRSKELHYSVRLYNLSELGKLLHDVGFRVAHVSGDVSTPGAFFGPSSPYLIIRAQRP